MSKIVGGESALGWLSMANPADLAAARRGDSAAIARLQQMNKASGNAHPHGNTASWRAFYLYPPLAKRAKRLQKMGSHLIAPKRAGGPVLAVFMTLLYLIIVPLLTVAGGLMLIVIGMLIGMNLMLLTVWLTAIHWIFVWINGR